MTPLAGLPVLTAAETRAAEDAAFASGRSVTELMDRAGAGVADWAARLGSGAPVLVLCGPGNNGGDGYVAAARLRDAGVRVKVAALRPPATDAARAAAERWGEATCSLSEAEPAPVLVDALLGTGVSRPLGENDAAAVARLAGAARLRIAIDLPSGLDADTGAAPGTVAAVDVTLALGTLKPAHLLQPGAKLCGAVRLVPLDLDAASDAQVLAAPTLSPPAADAHKYSRGLVALVAGAMPGAVRLAAEAALRGGAGYALVLGEAPAALPAAVVGRGLDAIDDARIGALVIGPGLGRDAAARELLDRALRGDRRRVIDGDALHLLDPDAVPAGAILTPHAGEFDALFEADGDASKLARTRAAAACSGAVVVHKGSDTVVAAPDGRAAIAAGASPWLATAGSGDVLAGVIAAQLAGGSDPFAAACAGVWLHNRAAERLGAGFIADDLAHAIGPAA